MRIAVLERERNGDRFGDDASFLDALISEWGDLGHDISVFRFPAWRVMKRMTEGHAGSIRLVSRLLSERFDVIYLRSRSFLWLGFLLRFLKRSSGIVVSWPKADSAQDEAARPGFVRDVLLSLVADRIALSEAASRGRIRDRYGDTATILMESPVIEPIHTTETLHDFGLREGHYMLFAPDVMKRDDLLRMVRVFRDLEETGKLPNNFKLVVLGQPSFPPESEPYLRAALGKRESILLLGEQSGRPRRELFSHAGMFVYPAYTGRAENLIEALGYALPVLAEHSPGNRDILRDSVGYFEDSVSLRRAVSALLIRPAASHELREASRVRFRTSFSSRSDAMRLVDLFDESMHLRAGRHYSMNRTERHV